MPNISRRIQHEQVRKLIDFIIFLSMDDKVFNERYNSAYNICLFHSKSIPLFQSKSIPFFINSKGIVVVVSGVPRKQLRRPVP